MGNLKIAVHNYTAIRTASCLTVAVATPEQDRCSVPEGVLNEPIGVVVPDERAWIKNPLNWLLPSSLTARRDYEFHVQSYCSYVLV